MSRRTAAEEARTLLAQADAGRLTAEGAPQVPVAYRLTADGTPLLLGCELTEDAPARLGVAGDGGGRVILTGAVEATGDAAVWRLRVERVRWVGGYGRVGSATGADYAAAEPDPVAGAADRAARHMTADHADALLAMARNLAGIADATAATCLRADRYGLDLAVATPRGAREARVAFAEPVTAPDGLRAAAVALTRRAQSPAA